jgi:hypothetical protein
MKEKKMPVAMKLKVKTVMIPFLMMKMLMISNVHLKFLNVLI